ncbi:hypothetical protein WJU16_14190 [Chitinophaga pollutisoli]|uniref:Uncharacterized protein n=1 Tax=Chitinophaga pollutisoli TaxID=3133966 RepID=A0ABZ2YHB6_9BACT
MRMLICKLTALAFFCACQSGQNKSAATGDSNTVASIAAVPVPVAPSFYIQYTGKLAGQPATMQLVKYAPGKYEGWYVYDKIGEPIGITLSRETADSLFFAEYAGVNNENMFSGVFNGGQYHGVWTGNEDTFGFDLVKDMDSIITFVAFMFEDSAKLHPNDPASPVARSSAAMVWPLGGADQDVIEFLRKSMQPEMKPGDMPMQQLKSSVLGYLSAYQENAKISDSSDLEFGPGAAWNWESHATESVVWNKYPYLTIGKMEYDYSGGAHGNYGTTFEAYDLAAKKKLKVTDVFKPGYKSVLGAALEKSYRRQYNVPAGESLDKGGSSTKTSCRTTIFI